MSPVVIAIICGVTAGLVATELSALASTFARKIITWSARRIYAHHPTAAEEYAEEWAAGIAGQGSNIAKLVTVLGFSLRALTTTRRQEPRKRRTRTALMNSLTETMSAARLVSSTLLGTNPTFRQVWALVMICIVVLATFGVLMMAAIPDLLRGDLIPTKGTALLAGFTLAQSLTFVLSIARMCPANARKAPASAPLSGHPEQDKQNQAAGNDGNSGS